MRHRRFCLPSRTGTALAAGALVAAIGLGACGGGGSASAKSAKSANADATAACAALARSNPVGVGTLALHERLLGAAELGLAAVGENGAMYTNIADSFVQIVTDVNSDKVSQLNGDVSSALALCKGDSLPH